MCKNGRETGVYKRKRNWFVKAEEKRAAYLHEEMLDDEDEGHNLGHLVNVLLHVVRVLMKIKQWLMAAILTGGRGGLVGVRVGVTVAVVASKS